MCVATVTLDAEEYGWLSEIATARGVTRPQALASLVRDEHYRIYLRPTKEIA